VSTNFEAKGVAEKYKQARVAWGRAGNNMIVEGCGRLKVWSKGGLALLWEQVLVCGVDAIPR
jgi:hypothetical protein